MTIQELIGSRIKKLRIEQELSQTALANMIGYKDKTAIAKIESGKVDLPQSKILAFANALNTSVSYLFGDDSPQQPHTLAAHFDGSEYTEEELDEIRQFAEFVKNRKK